MKDRLVFLVRGTPRRVLLRVVLVLLLAGFTGEIAGCGGGSTTGSEPTTPAPTNLSYAQGAITGIVGQAIAADAPSVTGTVTSYAVSPALPAGLSLNASSGVISGTPGSLAAQGSYTVTAANSSGSATAVVQITVNPAPPTNLVYPQSTITATVGQAISTDTPTVTGSVTGYTVSPALPAGLSVSASTGAISGTPTAVAAQASYTVTATNVSGSTTAVVRIAVNPAAPTSLVYPQTAITAVVGQAISTDTPTVTGSVTGYTVSPALPAGLSVSASTGAISGTPAAVAAQASYTVTATNVSGSTSAVVQIAVEIAPPTNLVYPQTTIAAVTGQAIAADTPTVTGTVTGYSVSPALPAGLSIDSSSGAISGTPTAVMAQAIYTVTATNASGSTTAAVGIAVNLGAPSNLTYPQTTITAFVNGAITTDVPSVTGTVTGYTVSPALPAGLSIDPSTGAISGTPTAVSAQATYTITASNTAGSTTANVTIAVNNFSQFSLLDLGHASEIYVMRAQSTRLFSQDSSGHWVLWDYASAAEIASGDAVIPSEIPYVRYPSDMAGAVIAVGTANAVEIRSNADGSLISTLTSPSLDPGSYCPQLLAAAGECTVTSWWELATDGSYVVSGYASGLFVWSTVDGHLIFSLPGNYAKAQAYAGPGQVQIAMGPAGTNVIETDSVPGGTSSIGPAFTATFYSWFSDGGHFFTSDSVGTVYIYSANSVQQGTVALIARYYTPLGGYGNWFWYNDSYDNFLDLYAVGGTAPAYTYTLATPLSQVIASGSTIGVLQNYSPVSVLDLSGTTPVFTSTSLPIGSQVDFAAVSPTQWAVGNGQGVLLDGPSTATTTRFFGYGNVLSMSGASGEVALATASGRILTYNPGSGTLLDTINFNASKIMLSDDGTVLAAGSNLAQSGSGQVLNIYSMPAGTVSFNYPYPLTYTGQYTTPGDILLLDFTLSGSGTVLGQSLQTYGSITSGSQSSTVTREVTPTLGNPVIWSDNPAYFIATGTDPLFLSRDGTLIAASSGPCNSGCYIPEFDQFTTGIYKNGILVATVNGVVAGWIDNNRLLVNTFTAPYIANTFPTYAGAAIYDANGNQLATFTTLPQLTYGNGGLPLGFQTVNSDAIYAPSTYSIYSLTTGAAIWTESFPSGATTQYRGASSLAGDFVVYTYRNRVYVDLP